MPVTVEGLLLGAGVAAFGWYIIWNVWRWVRPAKNTPRWLAKRIDQLQNDLGQLERGHLSLRDDHQMLERVVRGRSRTAGPATAAEMARAEAWAGPDWTNMDARLQALQKAVADLAGQPYQVDPKDGRQTQWTRVAQDDDLGSV